MKGENNSESISLNNSFLIPIIADKTKLQADLELCLAANWKEHFNQKDYSGSWTVIALRSQTGNPQDIYAQVSELPFVDTELLAKCNYFRELLADMKFEKETVRLLRLEPGSIVKTHKDAGLAYRYGCFRLHIPLVTDALVEFIVGGKNILMKKGECWYADFDLPHSVKNESERERIHLVIDGIRNAWTDELFAAAGYDFEEEKRMNDYSLETKKKIIEQLGFMNTPVAKEMIKKLELEIATASNPAKNV